MDQRPGEGPANKQQPIPSQAQQQDLAPQSPVPISPGRRKTIIDIDAALRLQALASYVQEPARPSSSSSSFSQKPASACDFARDLPARPSPSGTPPTTSTGTSAASLAPRAPLVRKQQNVNYYEQNYASTPSGRAPFVTTNISVDYIDCLSNNDLIAAPGTQLAPANGLEPVAPGAMRGIASCRKHLSRFHRSARVEPSEPPAPAKQAGADDSMTTSTNEGSASGAEQQPGPAHSSVLYPISVSEVRERTYFIGSVSQDSLLGPDELYRHFPTGRVTVFVCTWNQNRKRAPANLSDLLLPDRLVYMPDIYAVGIQEAFSSQQECLRDWEVELQTTLGPNHVLLHSCSLGVLHLSLFIRRDLVWFCSTPEESLYNSRSMPTNIIKTKGAISIAFRFFGTSLMFTNCHFPAHENRLKDRVDEYQRIINSIDLPKNLKLLKPRYLSNDSTARFDCVFFMGDLNFRLEQRTFDETIQILDDIFQSREQSFEALTQNDELLKVMESQQAFHGFDESQIKFPPTYKFLAQTNKYDRQTKRVPSYTDRILFRSKRQRHIRCLIYDWLPQLLSSDHKPVYCLFDVLIRPGREQNMVSSLNAGLFQRTVYLEALKRRAEDPDGIRENDAGGNFICSIS